MTRRLPHARLADAEAVAEILSLPPSPMAFSDAAATPSQYFADMEFFRCHNAWCRSRKELNDQNKASKPERIAARR